MASHAMGTPAEFIDDEEMLNMVQYHDESFALSRQFEQKQKYNIDRLKRNVLGKIQDLDLFLIFTIIDTWTDGKMHDAKWRLRWFYDEVRKHSVMNSARVNSVMVELGI